jgi:squalene synthase HpnC
MTEASALRSGKGHRDENFPVASWLIAPRHRPAVMAFYNFVRTADDIADHAALKPDEKLRLLDGLEAGLTGAAGGEAVAQKLKAALAERGLAPRHALDLLTAFRLDVTKLRYRDWNDLIDYCRYSAMPVGRFVLDVHGESHDTWPANDALCAALQIINHLQDCKKDYRDLDRVYIPQDALAAAGATVEQLGAAESSPPLLTCLHALARRTAALLGESDTFCDMIVDRRLSLEVAVIHTLAQRLTRVLNQRDPLADRVHLAAPQVAGLTLFAILRGSARRLAGITPVMPQKPRGA